MYGSDSCLITKKITESEGSARGQGVVKRSPIHDRNGRLHKQLWSPHGGWKDIGTVPCVNLENNLFYTMITVLLSRLGMGYLGRP